ncbi:MAG: aldehyde ferredoxin oxidoreductase family protein [Spirochaetes bacterium]|nr:aldehyde ferredoxin oxidoreductase family protein [Spirochaetota bacterium]
MKENGFIYPGRLLRVDLSSGVSSVEAIDPAVLRSFVGGRGLGAYLLYTEVPADTDPMGPENKLIFTNGPLVGTQAPCSGRFNISTKSPQTGIYLFSLCSGRFGEFMRRSGYEAVVVEGKATRPVYLLLDENKAAVKEADEFWGMDTGKTEKAMKRTLPAGVKCSVACIGPAGENLIKTACVISERRAAGRGGAGAVMGSKKLKAVVASGGLSIPLFDEQGFKDAVKKARGLIRKNPFLTESMSPFGSAVSLNLTSSYGIFPVRNWQKSVLEGIDALRPQTMREKYLRKDKACPSCPIACSKITAVDSGPFAGAETEGPEYETLYSFGGACDNASMESIILADQLCDELGMDTIACGVTIAFAMECFEKGIIGPKETDGIDLRFGNAEAIPEIIRKMAAREGIGELLADGVKAASDRLGRGTGAFAMHAKGMELGGYDPRGVKSQALVLACGPRGGCHHAGGYVIHAELVSGMFDRMAAKGKGSLVKQARDLRAVMDSAIYCAFLAAAFRLDVAAEMIRTSVGWDVDEKELARSGERISNIERMFNVKTGLRRGDDTLPQRLLSEPMPDGPSAGGVLGSDFDLMVDELYEACGWDKSSGIPTPEKLKELGLKTIIEGYKGGG